MAAAEASLFWGLCLWVGLLAYLRFRLLARQSRLQGPFQDLVREHLAAESPSSENLARQLKPWVRSQRLQHILRLAVSLSGEARLKLQDLARALGHVNWAQKLTTSWFWWKRLEGIRVLRGLAILPQDFDRLLQDRNPLVRAEAAYFVVDQPTPARVERLVSELFGPSSRARFASQNVLHKVSHLALKPLAHYLKNPPGPTLVALQTAQTMHSPELLAGALACAGSSEAAERAAAARLLGVLGGKQALERLSQMLVEPEPTVRSAAAEGLGRIGDWHMAAQLSACSQDSDWNTRLQASLALKRLGPPGELFLRQQIEQDPEGEKGLMARAALEGQPR